MKIDTLGTKPIRQNQHRQNTNTKNGLYIFGHLGETKLQLLVDTGAAVSVMPESVFNTIPKRFKPPLKHTDTVIVAVDGSKTTSVGKIYLPLQIGNTQIVEEFTISDAVNECILGMPVLKTAGFKLDLENMAICVDNKYIPVYDKLGKSLCCRVSVNRTVTIPANNEMIIPGMIQFRGQCTPEPYLLEPSKQFMVKHGLFVGKILVGSESSSIPVRVYNPQDETIVLYKGSNVGVVTPIHSIEEELGNEQEEYINLISSNDTKCEKGMVPEHLYDLWKRGSEHITAGQSNKLAKLLTKYQHVFSSSEDDIGRTDIVQHEIVTTDPVPIKQRHRRMPKCNEDEIERQITNMLAEGKIVPSNSPWSSPIVLANKRDGTKRLCIDYRKLNDKTVKDAYVIPVINTMLTSLAGASWFSTFDLTSGYHQVGLSEDAQIKSAFCSKSGLYHWLVMPFGLTGAPATFQRLMDRVLRGLSWKIAMVYLDDIIVIGKSVEDCIDNMAQVFERLSKAGLKLKPKKCFLLQRQVKYLGYIVSGEGIQTDPEKIDKVQNWPEPENISQLRSFLGLASYYRRHIPNFASVCRPLYKLCEKGQIFVLNEECRSALIKIKQLLTEAPILAYPTEKDEYILDTDASNSGIGAVLSQVQNGQEKVIAYSSRTLSKAERQYCVTRKELLAIVYHVRYFREYLYGVQFTIRTDHGSLRWLSQFKDIDQGQLARWLQILSEYNYTIETRPGRLSQNADALSRLPCAGKKCICLLPSSGKNSPIIECNGHSKDIGVQTDKPKLSSQLNRASVEKVKTFDTTKLWSTEEMKDAQKDDPDIEPILSLLLNQTEKPTWEQVSSFSSGAKALWSSWKNLYMRSGLLYRKWETLNGKYYHWQLVVPTKYHSTVLQYLHDNPTAGHFGVRKTLNKIQYRFYWYRMKNYVQTWVRTCIPCQAKDSHGRKAKAKLKQYVVGNRWERIATDLTGPFPISTNRNKYILVVTDYFTKFTEAYALPNMEAKTVADKLVKEWICRYGCPIQLHSDQGSNYQSALFVEVCKMLNIEQTKTTAFHPQSDGQAEKFMNTMKKTLTKMVESHESESDWDEVLPFVLMAYNSSVHETTNATPNSLVFGDEVALPIDMITDPPENDKPNYDTTGHYYAQYILDLQSKFWEGHQRAREFTSKAMLHQKRSYDKNLSNNAVYQKGSLVWLHNPKHVVGKTPKLQNPWDGPFVVIKAISDVLFKIQKSPHSKPKIVHYNRLKPFYSRQTISTKWIEKVPENPIELSETEENLANDDLHSSQNATDLSLGSNPEISQPGSKTRPKRQIKPPKRYGEWDYGISAISHLYNIGTF